MAEETGVSASGFIKKIVTGLFNLHRIGNLYKLSLKAIFRV